jgi:diguanylate cyclase (GGDEF)-like protein
MKVLVVEDSAVYRHLLTTQLSEFETEVVETAESALSVLRDWSESIVLVIDWLLPGMSGLELIGQLRKLERKHYIYVLVLTGRTDPSDVATALDAGADDYLGKPFDQAELKARIRAAARSLKLHDDLLAANDRLEALATQDPLTALFNRRGLLHLHHHELLKARRNHSPITVVTCDIDNFKQINDTYGHPMGDEALQTIAHALKSSSRGSDIVARSGGDEFVIVLPGTGLQGGVIFVERVQQFLLRDENRKSLSTPITMSFGIADMDISGSEEDAIAKADSALCAAKRKGRNCYCVAEDSNSR